MMRSLLLFLLVAIHVAPVYSGPWNKAKNKGYVQFGLTYLTYDQILNGSEKRIDLKRSISDHTLQLYAEYGLSDKFNLILNLPFKMVGSGETLNPTDNDPYPNDTLESGSLTGLSSVEFGLRYVILEKKYILSAQVTIGNNMHRYDHGSGLQIGYDTYQILPSLLLGRGWKKKYLQLGAGVQLRSNNYAQNFIGMFEAGHKFFKDKTLLILRIDAKIPVTNGTFDERNSVQTALFRDNSAYLSPGLKINQQLTTHLYVNFGAYIAPYSVLEGAQISLNGGLAYDW
ncbi:MAG TPA: hypothetical protein DCX54_10195 [Flavobacteriales bacterium]|nr:hypothetical protein [Flavobacteriales bacterium]